MTKIKLGRKGLIWLTFSYHDSSSKEIKAEAGVEAMKDYTLLPMMLSQLFFFSESRTHHPAVPHPQ